MSMVSDHAKCIKDFNRIGIPIFGNASVKKKNLCVRTVPTGRSFDPGGGWKVIAFDVPHSHNDGEPCENYAYIISKDGERLLYMTDWMYCKYDLSKFNIGHFLIAVNYTDLEEDEVGKIGHVARGHSSLDTAKEFLKTSMTDSCRNIIACHLSQLNCNEDMVLQELKGITNEKTSVFIAKKALTFNL